jgi:hypothetical protein
MLLARRMTVTLGCLAFAASAANAGDFNNKTVSLIQGPDGRPCTFFILDGVSSADPATPGTPWMALRQSSSGYKENLVILMTAKLAGRPINVSTTGLVVAECGLVEAYRLMLP